MAAEPPAAPTNPPTSGSSGVEAARDIGPDPDCRDRLPYASLLALLRSTWAFQDVVFGDALQRSRSGADGYPLAVVTPRSWEESDEYDPVLLARRVSFTVTVLVKAEDAGSQFEVLDRLASAVQGAVNRSDLGGTSLPALTKISAGRYGQVAHHPERSLELDGSFTTLIDPTASITA